MKNLFGTNDRRQQAYWEEDHRFRTYDHPIVRFFAQQRIQYIRTWFDLTGVESALDVGCGDGFSTYYMREHIPDIWAVDRSHRMLSRHPLRGTGKIGVADVLELPFRDKAFDLVYGWEVLHHIADPRQAVAEMARVSRRYVLAVEPNRYNPFQFGFALVDREHRWVLRYSTAYLRSVFASVGLGIAYAGSGGWVFPNKTPRWLMPLLSRIPYRSPFGISTWVLGQKP